VRITMGIDTLLLPDGRTKPCERLLFRKHPVELGRRLQVDKSRQGLGFGKFPLATQDLGPRVVGTLISQVVRGIPTSFLKA
jgi:hypothetical protein